MGIVGSTDRHDRQGVGEERRILQQPAALMQSLKDQLQLAKVSIEDCLLQVPHATMHQLCGPGGRPCAKVLLLYQRSCQPPAAEKSLSRDGRGGLQQQSIT